MKLRIAALAAAGVLGATAFAAGGIAGPEYKNQYPNNAYPAVQCQDDDDTPDTVTFTGPEKLWPPNHKLQANEIIAAGDSDDDPTLAVNGYLTDAAGGDGGPNHDPDVMLSPLVPGDDGDGTSANPVMASNTDGDTEGTDGTDDGVTQVLTELRAERSGRSGPDGSRVYTLDWTADFGDTAPDEDCSGTFTITVPHDMSNSTDRDGRTNGN